MPSILCFPEEVPELIGDAVRLRAVTEEDLPAWFMRATDRESADLAGDPIPESISEGAALLQRNRERFKAQQAIRWTILAANSCANAGSIGLGMVCRKPAIAELSVVVGRSHWRHGLATAATKLVLAYGFDVLGLNEVRAEVLQRNVASVRLLEKSGFRLQRAYRSEVDLEDCFEYVLRSTHAGAG